MNITVFNVIFQLMTLMIATYSSVSHAAGNNSAIEVSNASAAWLGYKKLSGAEIKSAFSHVMDRATVMDGAGGSAINYWFKDGRFSSHWTVGDASGKLSGRWSVEGDLRCVVLDTPVAGLDADEKRCGPLYFKDNKYYSSNKSGSVHGVHVLTDL